MAQEGGGSWSSWRSDQEALQDSLPIAADHAVARGVCSTGGRTKAAYASAWPSLIPMGLQREKLRCGIAVQVGERAAPHTQASSCDLGGGQSSHESRRVRQASAQPKRSRFPATALRVLGFSRTPRGALPQFRSECFGVHAGRVSKASQPQSSSPEKGVGQAVQQSRRRLSQRRPALPSVSQQALAPKVVVGRPY